MLKSRRAIVGVISRVLHIGGLVDTGFRCGGPTSAMAAGIAPEEYHGRRKELYEIQNMNSLVQVDGANIGKTFW